MENEKRIESVELTVGDLRDELGNPRKITKKKLKELQESIETFGDFGVIVIDDKNNIISGHQRVQAMRQLTGDGTKVLCKRLVGYSEPELRAINLKANTHVGEWDMNLLAQWTADLTLKVGIDIPKIDDINDRKMPDMELIRYEKYDYVMIVCRNEIDYINLQRALGIEDRKVLICKTSSGSRKIKARAIWYDQIQCDIKKK